MNKLINKKYIKLFTSILCIGVLFVASIGNVFAGNSITAISCPKDDETGEVSTVDVSGGAAAGGGTDLPCMGAQVCYSTMGTQGLRFALVDKNGVRKSKILDYWFMTSNGFEYTNEHFIKTNSSYNSEKINSSYTVEYKNYVIYEMQTKTLMQETKIYNSSTDVQHNNSDDSVTENYKSKHESITSILPKLYDCKFSINHGTSTKFGYNYYATGSSENLYYTQSQHAVVQILLANKKNNYFKKIKDVLAKNLLSGVSSDNLDSYFVQIEPLVQFSIRTKAPLVYNYIGSWSDVWFMTHYDTLPYGMYLMRYAGYKNSWPGMAKGNHFTNDFTIVAYGNFLHPTNAKDIPSNFYLYNDEETLGKPGAESEIGSYAGKIFEGDSKVFIKNGDGNIPTLGVTFIRWSYGEDSCSELSKKLVKSNKISSPSNLSTFFIEISKSWTGKKGRDGLSSVNNIADAFKFLTATYEKATTTAEKFNPGNKYDSANNLLLNKYFGLTYNNYCATSDCNSVLTALKNGKKLNKSNLNILAQLYGKYQFLDIDTLTDLFGDVYTTKNKAGEEVPDLTKIINNKAECKETPQCIAPSTNAKCSNYDGNKFVIQDFRMEKHGTSTKSITGAPGKITSLEFARTTEGECLKAGIAYNNYSDGSSTKSTKLQSAFETTYYGTVDNPAVCWESVEFNLPGSVRNIEAGTIFMWGKGNKDGSTDNNKFGTMTVRRYCTVTRVMNKSDYVISSVWAVPTGDPLTETKIVDSTHTSDVVNPKITIHYQQALPKGVTLSNGLKNVDIPTKIQLGHIQTELYSYKDNYSKNLDGYNDVYVHCGEYDWEADPEFSPGESKCADKWNVANNPLTIHCTDLYDSSNNSKPPVIYVEATYDILYDENYKWYSDKSDNYSKKMKNTIEPKDSVDNAKYVSLGYGLPTSFVTPPLPKNQDYFYGYSASSSNDGGYMYAEIDQIGTKRGSSYHFNKLKVAIKDDDTEGTHSGVVYSCGFNIQNRLYCFECSPDIPKGCPNGVCTPPGDVPKGIDVVFRTVELVDTSSSKAKDAEDNMAIVFPGRSGKGRKIGLNWQYVAGEEIDDSFRENFFSDKTYSRDPKYVIDLTSPLIQEIRKTNKNNSYTSLNEYEFVKKEHKVSDYNYDGLNHSQLIAECSDEGDSTKCFRQIIIIYKLYSAAATGGKDKNGKEVSYEYTRVSSKFLSDLISDGKLTGTCATEADTKKRAANFSDTLGC